MTAFADTSGLYAAVVKNEEWHRESVASLEALLEKGRTIFTTSYVMVETAALLQHRIGLEAVRDFEEHLVPFLNVEWVGQPLHRQGMERLFREDRRNLSLVDCVSLEFIRTSGLSDVLGLDRHFLEAGLRLLPLEKKR